MGVRADDELIELMARLLILALLAEAVQRGFADDMKAALNGRST